MSGPRPAFWPTVFTLVFATLFITLGFWQLERANEKEDLAATRSLRRNMAALVISGQPLNGSEIIYRTLEARGTFLTEKSVLIENRKHQGVNGFHLLTPLHISADLYLLINRGWLAAPPGNQLPELPDQPGEVVITGEAKVPSAPYLVLDTPDRESETLPRWAYISISHFEQWSGLRVYPFMLLQNNSPDLPGSWSEIPPANGSMHIGYALQWFAFALIAIIYWMRMLYAARVKNA